MMIKSIIIKISAFALTVLLIGCASSPKYTSQRKPSMRWNVKGETLMESDVGIASFYGAEFAGRKTAAGDIYNPEGLTAAHPTYPFGTRVRVVNLKNNKSVEVVVNDRGPFVEGRIIDLSRGAAEKIGMVADGTVMVRVEVLQWGIEE